MSTNFYRDPGHTDHIGLSTSDRFYGHADEDTIKAELSAEPDKLAYDEYDRPVTYREILGIVSTREYRKSRNKNFC